MILGSSRSTYVIKKKKTTHFTSLKFRSISNKHSLGKTVAESMTTINEPRNEQPQYSLPTTSLQRVKRLGTDGRNKRKNRKRETPIYLIA